MTDDKDAEIAKLRFMNQQLVSRLAAAIEVLCRRSNGQDADCPHCGKPIDWKRIVGA